MGKIAKLNSANLKPCDSGRLAGHLSTYDYALYQYFKVAIYSLSSKLSSWESIQQATRTWQPRGLTYIVAVMSHLGVKVLPN